MKKRRLLLIASLPLAVAVIFGVLAMLSWPLPSRGVTKANFDRIEKGMAKEDVDGIFCHSGMEYRSNAKFVDFGWKAEDGAIAFVRFSNGCAISMNWHDSTETIFQRIGRYLDEKLVTPPPQPPPTVVGEAAN